MANIEEHVIDTVYGLDILDKDSFEKLTVLPPNTPIRKVKEYSFNNKRIKVFNDKYLSSYDKAKGDITLEKIDDKYKVPEPFLRDVVQLPNQYTKLKDVSIQLAADENKTLCPHVRRENLGALLSFFTIYPDFGPVYEEYMLDPDFGIELVDEIEVGGSLMPESYTSNDFRATAHLLLLLMADNFNSENLAKEEYITKYLENRLKALHAVLNDPNVKFLLTTMNLEHMSYIWNSYPKLKLAVFYFAISIRSRPEMRAATMLLAESSMLNLLCIFQFTEAKPISRAHYSLTLWQEFSDYIKKCTKLRTQLGELWTYLNVIRPDDTTLSPSKFPNLSRAAAVYVRQFFNKSTTFQRVEEPNFSVDIGLVDAAKSQVCSYNIILTREEERAEARLRNDVNKWQASYEMRKILRMDEPYEQDSSQTLQQNFQDKSIIMRESLTQY